MNLKDKEYIKKQLKLNLELKKNISKSILNEEGFVSPSDEVIKRIIEKANTAPTGDNCQPWVFIWSENQLMIHHKNSRAKHELNYKNKASLLSLGCLIEALKMASELEGLSIEYTLDLSELLSKHPWAKVKFKKIQKKKDSVSEYMTARRTDRRTYLGGSLEDIGKNEISKLNSEFNLSKVYFSNSFTKSFKNYLVKCEYYMWTDLRILKDLLKWMRLSPKEFENTNDGMSWSNVGLSALDAMLFRLLRKTPKIVPFIWNIGIRQKVGYLSRKQLSSSAGLINIVVKEDSKEALIEAGQLSYRLWILLTSKNYGVQPLTVASLFSFLSETKDLPKDVSTKYKNIFSQGRALMREVFGFGHKELTVWMFRTGKSKGEVTMTAKTKRLNSDKVLFIKKGDDKKKNIKN